jgi:S1-C subfamily serine protease
MSWSELSKLAGALNGLPVLGCLAGSPAAQAGVKYGDILLSLDGKPTTSWDDFLLARREAKGSFTVRLFRDGAEIELVIPLREVAARTPMELLAELLGLH